MSSLLDIISEHSQANSIVPIIAIFSIIFTVIIYAIFRQKWIKYIVASAIIIVGLIMFYYGYKTMLETVGLDMIITASKVLVFGIVSLAFSLILEIFDSFADIFKNKKKQKIKKNIKRNKKMNEIANEIPDVKSVENIDETIVIKKNKVNSELEKTKVIDINNNDKTTVIDKNEVKRKRKNNTENLKSFSKERRRNK